MTLFATTLDMLFRERVSDSKELQDQDRDTENIGAGIHGMLCRTAKSRRNRRQRVPHEHGQSYSETATYRLSTALNIHRQPKSEKSTPGSCLGAPSNIYTPAPARSPVTPSSTRVGSSSQLDILRVATAVREGARKTKRIQTKELQK
ncbi:hypothetical protein PLICRDRAFT_533300 [Plicaturopsis crispa FD-325 SS-3]|nr:hypothetical protein PLICRDRAFT_533300 [Plicaturopsis crispa FD-325 SS-3]